MTNEIDPSNKSVRQLRLFCREHFTKCPAGIFEDILQSCDHILNTNQIILSEVVKPKDYGSKEISAEQRIETLKKYNSTKILPNNRLGIEYEQKIIDLLVSYKSGLVSPVKKTEEIKSLKYENAKKTEYGDSHILPLPDTLLSSIKKNLFYDKDSVYVYNESIPIKQLDTTIPHLQSLKLKINGIIDIYNMPTKYEVRCSHQKDGIECGNVVHFCDVHLNSTIKCSDSGGIGEGHTIKKPEHAPIFESKEIYIYEGEDLNNPESKEILIYSLVKLDYNIVKVNAIFVNEKKINYIFVVSVKEEKIKPLKENILIRDPNSFYFLNDFYTSIQKYLKQYHDIALTNQNKIVGQILSFMLINNIIYGIRTNALIMGKSGSGKSIWSEYLIPLLSLNNKTVIGTDITRNRFIGGRANIVSEMKNSMFSVGYIATQDFIFAEEGTNSLEKFHDPRLDQSNNIFHLLKICSGRKIDVAIQGGGKVFPKASTALVGNLEQLKFTQEYKWWVANKYRKMDGGKTYNENWPLFKPISYYIDILKNRELAEAHAIVRQNHKNLAGIHYITRLPPAEQVRYDFCVVLEDDYGTKKRKRKDDGEKHLENPKRDFLIKELSGLFLDENGHPRPVPRELKTSINDFWDDEYYPSRNNFKNMFGVERDINTHFENSVIQTMRQLIWLNRQYYSTNGKVFEGPLNDDEKSIIKYFLAFNYNTLSQEEASCVKQPRINDFKDIENSIDLAVDIIQKAEQEREDMKSFLQPQEDDDEEEMEFN